MTASTDIDVHFRKQYADGLIHLVQQKGSRLLGTVTNKPVSNSMLMYFDRLGTTTALEKFGRHESVTQQDMPHSRVRVTPRDFYNATYIDDEDAVRMLNDPASDYAMAQAWALGRKIDDLIIASATGAMITVDEVETTTSTTLPAGQTVGEDVGAANSHLNLEKLIRAIRILDSADVDPHETTYCIINSYAKESLLNTTEVTNSDYASIKALVNGQVNSFLGMNFVLCNRILGAGTEGDPDLVLVWKPSGMGFSSLRSLSVQMDKIPQMHYMTQVYASMSGGATRIENEKVVSIECVRPT